MLQIEVATMNGTKRQVLLAIDGEHPFSLALHGNTLYWSDWTKTVISRLFLNNGSTLHLLGIKYPPLDRRIGGLLFVNTSSKAG